MTLVCRAIHCVDLVQIKLWYAAPYEFRLGSLLTVSTTHISSNSPISTGTQPATIPASISSSIFPQRDSGCQIEERCSESSITPICYAHGQPLVGLMTLKDFTCNDGDSTQNAKVLVCVTTIGRPEACMLCHTQACEPTRRIGFPTLQCWKRSMIIGNVTSLCEACTLANTVRSHIQRQLANDCCLSRHTRSILPCYPDPLST